MMKAPVLCFSCRGEHMELDLNKDHQHLRCPRCEDVWCFVCIGRVEITISEEWLRRQRSAMLN